MTTWQEKTLQGNKRFHQGDWCAARELYTEAIQSIEALWFSQLEDRPLMMAWIANMHNLALLYEKIEQPQEAGKCYMIPYRRVLYLMKEDCFTPEFQQTLLYAMRTAALELLDFSKRYPICPCCQDKLKSIGHWLNEHYQSTRLSALKPALESGCFGAIEHPTEEALLH